MFNIQLNLFYSFYRSIHSEIYKSLKSIDNEEINEIMEKLKHNQG